MKNVIWIDKCLSLPEMVYPSYFKDEDVKIHPFDSFKSAMEFINNSDINIDLAISNYCTFSWTDDLYADANEDEVCFSFYNKISNSFPKLPFILFSSYSQRDKRLEDYINKKSFFYIDKGESAAFEQIKRILNQTGKSDF